MPLDDIIPLLLQQSQQNRAQARKKQREDLIFSGLQILQDPNASFEEKTQAYSEVTAKTGMSFPGQLVPKPDRSAWFDAVGAPEWVRVAHDSNLDVSEQQIAKWAITYGDKPGQLAEKDIQTAIDLDVFKGTRMEGKSAAHIASSAKVGELLGQGLWRDIVKGEADKTPDFALKQQAINKLLTDDEGQLRAWEDISEDPLTQASLDPLGVTRDDLEKFYNASSKPIVQAEKGLTELITAKHPMLQWTRGPMMAKWISGEAPEDEVEKSVFATFNEFYNKQTGRLKVDKVIEYADRITDAAAIRAGFKTQVAEEIPKHLSPLIVYLGDIGLKTKAELETLIEDLKKAEADPHSEWTFPFDSKTLEEALPYHE